MPRVNVANEDAGGLPFKPSVWERKKAYWARRYRKLVDSLGGKCKWCGATEELEIDHINGRDYEVNRLSLSMRIARYCREAREGLVQVLCKTCNLAKRYAPQPGESEDW